MYRGRSTKGRIYDFDPQAYEQTRPLSCQLELHELSLESESKLEGNISAALSVDINRSQNISLADLGHLKTKSGHYVWNEKTTKRKGMLPTSVTVKESDKIVVRIILKQKKIPLLNRHEKEIHS